MRFFGLLFAGFIALGATTAVAQDADLLITKTDNATTVTAGTKITYRITVTNQGPDEARNVVWSDIMPDNLSTPTLTLPAEWRCGLPAPANPGWRISCSLSALPAGKTYSFAITADLAASAAGTLSNTATVTSDTPDSNIGNNSATDISTIVPVAAPAAVPTLTEWAMILLGGLLAGGAALHLHRRRQAA